MAIYRLFERKRINLQIDQCFNTLNGYSVTNFPQSIDFYLWDLIIAYGTKKSPKYNPTWLNKILAFDYLAERVSADTDFKIDITRIRNHHGHEELKNSSEAYGEAFSLLLVQRLFNTRLEKVQKVNATGKRADYHGQTELGNTIAFEAKGTINNNTHTRQRLNGRVQLNRHQANIKAIFASLLNENHCSTVAVDDPPGNEFKFTRDEMIAIEAENMARMFNFFGLRELSRYFSLMERRIRKDGFNKVVDEKESLFEKIKTEYVVYQYRQRKFKGQITKTNGKFVFVGIAENLIYFHDFVNLPVVSDSITDKDEDIILYRNRILIKEMDNLSTFSQDVKYTDLVNAVSVADLHYLPVEACINLLIKVFFGLGYLVGIPDGYKSALYVLNPDNGKEYWVIFLKFFTSEKSSILKTLDRYKNPDRKMNKMKTVLITPNTLKFEIDGIDVVDRPKLKSFLENKTKIFE